VDKFFTAIAAAIAVKILEPVTKWTDQRTAGIRHHISRWLVENAAYACRGFRYVAVLDCDGNTLQANLTIGKRTPPVGDGDIRRLGGPVRSHVFEPARRFAWRAAHSWVGKCTYGGWNPIYIVAPGGPPKWAIASGQGRWILRVGVADQQPCIFLRPGWSPFRPAFGPDAP
jgi:hypothetical protein